MLYMECSRTSTIERRTDNSVVQRVLARPYLKELFWSFIGLYAIV